MEQLDYINSQSCATSLWQAMVLWNIVTTRYREGRELLPLHPHSEAESHTQMVQDG